MIQQSLSSAAAWQVLPLPTLSGKSGVAVSVLEARDRIGGRVHTLQDPSAGIPIELGAEFIHGRAPQILDPLKEAKVEITEVDGDGWCVEDGELSTCNFFEDVGKILDKMDDAGPDESFADFLEQSVGRPKSDKLSHGSNTLRILFPDLMRPIPHSSGPIGW